MIAEDAKDRNGPHSKRKCRDEMIVYVCNSYVFLKIKIKLETRNKYFDAVGI